PSAPAKAPGAPAARGTVLPPAFPPSSEQPLTSDSVIALGAVGGNRSTLSRLTTPPTPFDLPPLDVPHFPTPAAATVGRAIQDAHTGGSGRLAAASARLTTALGEAISGGTTGVDAEHRTQTGRVRTAAAGASTRIT